MTILFALLTVPIGHRRSASRWPRLAHQRLKRHPVYRTIFSSTVATSVAVASVIFCTLIEPAGRAPASGCVDRPRARRSSTTRTGAARGGRHHDLADLGLTFIILMRRAAGDPRRAARERPGRRRRHVVAVPQRHAAAALAHALLRGRDRLRSSPFQTFGQIDLLTQGGPLRQDRTCSCTSIYQTPFESRTPGGDGPGGHAVRDRALLTLSSARSDTRSSYARAAGEVMTRGRPPIGDAPTCAVGSAPRRLVGRYTAADLRGRDRALPALHHGRELGHPARRSTAQAAGASFSTGTDLGHLPTWIRQGHLAGT